MFTAALGAGRGKAHPPPPGAEQQLRVAMAAIDKREAELEALRDKASALAKDFAKKHGAAKSDALKKQYAASASKQLQQVKIYDKSIAQQQAKRANVQQQLIALGDAASNGQVLNAMKSSTQAIKQQIGGEKGIDAAHDIIEDASEVVALSDEVSAALGSSVGVDLDVGDDFEALKAEVAEEEAREIEDDLLEAPSVPHKRVDEEVKADFSVAKVSAGAGAGAGAAARVKSPVVVAPAKKKVLDPLEEMEAAMGV